MSSLEIARLGNPILRKIAEPVDLQALADPDSEIQAFIDAMTVIMREEEGVGLAAPQVSRSLRIIVVESLDNKRYDNRPDIPLAVFINPRITCYAEEQILGWESCLSLADFRGLVPRSKQVTMEAYNRRGEKQVVEAKGFFAVVLQHEIDHLNGLVFLDRMTDLTKLAYQKEFETYWVEDAKQAAKI
ncbi:MAG: peptide deformylase [Nitrospinales bacterium]